MTVFTFFWSPEGRRLASYKAAKVEDAKAEFRRDFPEHAKYMGEVYFETKPAK